MWCFVLEWGVRIILFRVVVRGLWSTLTYLLCILCSIIRLALFLRSSRLDHFNTLSMFVTLLVSDSHFEQTLRLTFEQFLFYVWGFCHGCHIAEQYSTWGRTFVLYAASFCCLFCVLTFRLMNLILFSALLVIVFMWDDQLRLLLIVIRYILRCLWFWEWCHEVCMGTFSLCFLRTSHLAGLNSIAHSFSQFLNCYSWRLCA